MSHISGKKIGIGETQKKKKKKGSRKNQGGKHTYMHTHDRARKKAKET